MSLNMLRSPSNRQEMPYLDEAAVAERQAKTAADELQALHDDMYHFGLESYQRLYDRNPQALLALIKQPGADTSGTDSLANLERIVDNHAHAERSLQTIRSEVKRRSLRAGTDAVNPDDLHAGSLWVDALGHASRRVVIENAIHTVATTRTLPKWHCEAVRVVATDLARKVSNPLAQQSRAQELDDYCNELLGLSLAHASGTRGLKSPLFNGYGELYKNLANSRDPSPLRRAIAASLDAQHAALTGQAAGTSRRQTRALAQIDESLRSGQLTDSSPEYQLYRQYLQTMKALSQATSAKTPEVREPVEKPAPMTEGLTPSAPAATEAVVRTRPKVMSVDWMRDEQSGGLYKGIVRVATGAALVGVSASAVATPAVAAESLGHPAHDMNNAVTVHATERGHKIPKIGAFIAASTAESVASGDTASAPEQPSSATAPATPQQHAIKSNQPGSTSSSASQATVQPPSQTTHHEAPATTPAPATEIAQPSAMPVDTERAANYTFIAANGEASDAANPIIKTPQQELKEYVTTNQYLNRADVNSKVAQLFDTGSSETIATTPDTLTSADYEHFNKVLTQYDTAYNNQLQHLQLRSKLNFVVPTSLAHMIVYQPDFLAVHNPKDVYSSGPAARYIRTDLHTELGADLIAHLGPERSQAVLNLLTTAGLQLLSDHQKAQFAQWEANLQQATAATPTDPSSAPAHDPQPSNHPATHTPKPDHTPPTHQSEFPHTSTHHQSANSSEVDRLEQGILAMEGYKGPHADIHGVNSHVWAEIFAATAARYPNPIVTADLLAAQVGQESNLNPQATSSVGAEGPSQFMPGTAATWVHGNPRDPRAAIDAQARYDEAILHNNVIPRYGGFSEILQRHLMLAGYNAGPGSIDQYGTGVLSWSQPSGYVASIDHRLSILERYNPEHSGNPVGPVGHINPTHGHTAPHNPDHAPQHGGYHTLRKTIEHTPGVGKIISHTNTGVPVPDKLGKTVYYNQWDHRWNDKQYNAPNHHSVMEASGCGPTTEAMVISTLSGKQVYPYQMAVWNQQHGYRVNVGTAFGALVAAPKAFGLQAEEIPLNMDAIKQVLARGGMVIVNGTDTNLSTPATSEGHIYAIRDVTSDGQVLVSDANSITKSLTPYAPSEILGPASVAVGVWK